MKRPRLQKRTTRLKPSHLGAVYYFRFDRFGKPLKVEADHAQLLLPANLSVAVGGEPIAAMADRSEFTQALADRLRTWATHLIPDAAPRVEALAAAIAASMPHDDVNAVAVVAQSGLWCFAADAVFDDPAATPRDLEDLSQACAQVLRGQTTNRNVPLIASLMALKRDLAGFGEFSRYGEAWRDEIDEYLASMRWEALASAKFRSGSAPPLDLYLAHALTSTAVPLHAAVCAIVVDDAPGPLFPPPAQALIRAASLCVRLANDLRTSEKELVEGKVNAVAIRSSELMDSGFAGPTAWDSARVWVRERAAAAFTTTEHALRAAQSPSGRWERAVAGAALAAAQIYATRDFGGPPAIA